MSNQTDSSVGSDTPRLDELTLWLNYENKIDELRSRFLTIAGLLFTLQSGIFALMLDKIFLSDNRPSLALSAEVYLVILSILTLIFLFIISSLYKSHIEANSHRSAFVVEKSNAIRVFKNEVKNYLHEKSPKYENRSLTRVIYEVWLIYGVLFLCTVGMPILRRMLN